MNYESIRQIADAVLFEGYMLYPYRDSSVKNQKRFHFGTMSPESALQTEVLIEATQEPRLEVTLRCLELLENGAVTRENSAEPVIERIGPDLLRGTVRITEDSIKARADLVSVHAILHVTEGAFVSLTDPPDRFREAATACRNVGLWPVLAGDADSSEYMLASPIILADYPQIAPESAGDLFDATEIDEILSLRIMTLTDSEKEEMRQRDEHTRRILERTESLTPGQLMKMHGVLRNPHALDGAFRRGDRVRLWPKKSADIMDLALKGQIAEVESVEVDYEHKVHLAVVIEDDPGKDLGMMRQPGHRFFFSPEEVERI